MKLFGLTLRFLTQIPFPISKDGEILPPEEFAKGIVFFPIIGLIIGFFVYIAYYLSNYVLMGLFPVICAVLAEIFVTGAFHMDGLADSCDGLFSSRKKEQMLSIMRDSRIGTNGVIAIIFDILLKIMLLLELQYFIGAKIFLFFPIAGKIGVPFLMNSQYAREENGLGNIYVGRVSFERICITSFLGMLLLLLAFGQTAIFPILAVVGVSFLFKKYVEYKIGGMTGDILGAGSELFEVIFLIVFMVSERGYFF